MFPSSVRKNSVQKMEKSWRYLALIVEAGKKHSDEGLE